MILYYNIPKKYRLISTIIAVLLAVVLNCAGNYLAKSLEIPIFMDSIFTVMTAALFGLIPSILVGLLTNGVMEIIYGFPGYLLPFAIVNILSGIVTALMVNRGFLKNITGIIPLTLALALVNAIVGAVIVTMIFGGITNEQTDSLVRAILITGKSVFTSAFLARILINIVDKGIAVILTYFVYRSIDKKYANII